ncbi:MAG TPA: methylmalonyl Co-A mutase-associated GTPase MeaB [Firmicutes bacterium]|nr:methylmalonyl Co-A mutase-associated GTPase MeaB [Bacillota bacterium]
MSASRTAWQEAFLSGERRALARAISAAENDPLVVQAFLREHSQRLGRARIIGITGPPGAGKSTLTGCLATELAKRGFSLGLLLVDPSSPFTGGAILGDRLRLPEVAQHPQVFVRSMSSRGSMGGLSKATSDAVKLLDAFGKDIVLIETVGTGQAETDIISVADSVVVVSVPGLGDDIQAMKAGILEIADLFVVNKADREGSDKTERELLHMLKMQPPPSGWSVPVIKTVAVKNEGIVELADQLLAHYDFLQQSGLLAKQRAARAQAELNELLRSRIMQELEAQLGPACYEELTQQIVTGKLSVYDAASELWQQFLVRITQKGGSAHD